MELVGVVAAVPELVKLAKAVGTALGQISSKGRIAKVAHGLRAQLELLADILEGVRRRHEEKNDVFSSSQNKAIDRLTPVLRDMRSEILELQHLVDTIEGRTNGSGPGFLKRAQLVLSGFETKFKECAQRIDRLMGLLQVYLTESALRSSHRSQLRNALRPSITVDFIPEKLQGTLEWIWSHSTFRQWTGKQGGYGDASSSSLSGTKVSSTDVRDRILSVYGVKGCGKSVLAASVAKGFTDKGVTTIFFSFWSGKAQDIRSDALFRAMLWSLLDSLPEEKRATYTSRLLERQVQLKSPNSLAAEVQRLGGEHQSEICCIIDGIDESADNWNDMRDGPLPSLVKILQSNSRMKLLLVGRQSSLHSALRRWPLQIELTEEVVNDDLKKFIHFELNSCPNITDEDVRERVRRELESKSTVMFLWVKLVFQELRLSFSSSEISITLSRLPDELDREYHRLLLRLMSRLNGRPNSYSVGMQRARGLLSL